MDRAERVQAARTAGVFPLGDDVIDRLVRRRLRDGDWVRVLPRVVATAPLGLTSLAWAAWLRFGGVVSGEAALAVHGALAAAPRVDLCLGDRRHRRSPRPWLETHAVSRPPDSRCALPVTAPELALADALAWTPFSRGVIIADEVMRRSPRTWDLPLPLRPRAARVLAVADARSMSGLETRARLLCIAARLPPATPQLLVNTAGGRRYLDLGFADFDVGLELDGRATHEGRLVADIRRDQELFLAGWTVLHFTGPDLTRSPLRTVGIIAEALRRAGWQGQPAPASSIRRFLRP